MAVRKLKLVELEWQDIEEHAGWATIDPKNLVTLKSYGLLVENNRWYITLANCYDPETDHISGKCKYPKGAVINIRVIEEVIYGKGSGKRD